MSAVLYMLKKDPKNTEIKNIWIRFGNLGKFRALIFEISLAIVIHSNEMIRTLTQPHKSGHSSADLLAESGKKYSESLPSLLHWRMAVSSWSVEQLGASLFICCDFLFKKVLDDDKEEASQFFLKLTPSLVYINSCCSSFCLHCDTRRMKNRILKLRP